MKGTPSDLWVDAIVRGYRIEAEHGKAVTPSGIWDQIVGWAVPQQGMFARLLDWDSGRDHNRIRTSMETVSGGYVPRLRLSSDGKGRVIVVEEVRA